MIETEKIERTMDMKNLKKKILGAVFGLFAAISLTVPSYAAVCVSGSADSLQQDPECVFGPVCLLYSLHQSFLSVWPWLWPGSGI